MDGPGGTTRDGTAMIVVTRLNGPRFAVNPDLLQRVESTPDTILTLIDDERRRMSLAAGALRSAAAHAAPVVAGRWRELMGALTA